MIELIFNGTGTSSSLPSIDCLTNPDTTCRSCPLTLKPEGKKNIRRNTGAILRKKVRPGQANGAQATVSGAQEDSKDVVIVIDVGKTFIASALEWFPKYGLRKIDALLLTHAHADAINGLDDLRTWTLDGKIQDGMDVYLSSECFDEIKRAFPYLVSKDFATGGGDVPEFRWHIVKDGQSFSVGGDDGFWITALQVDHGRMFPTGKKPSAATLSVPMGYTPSDTSYLQHSGVSTPKFQPMPAEPVPLKCFSFIFNETLVYMSDVSNIPEDRWSTLMSPPTRSGAPASPPPKYEVFVVDVLRPAPYISHFGIDQAVSACRRLGARKNFMMGVSHELNHDEWVALGEGIGAKQSERSQIANEWVEEGLKLVSDGAPVWMRPAFDGLRILIPEKEGDADDDGYSS